MAKRNRKGTGLMDGRGVAIAVIALVSGASFAFGFYVGKITTDVTKEIQIVTVPSETEPVKKKDPVTTSAEEPAVTATKPKATPTSPVKAKTVKKKLAKTYSLQVGAFSKRKDAESLQQKFKGMGYSAYLLRTTFDGGKAIYKVRLGKFREKKDAEDLALKLDKISDIEAFITRN